MRRLLLGLVVACVACDLGASEIAEPAPAPEEAPGAAAPVVERATPRPVALVVPRHTVEVRASVAGTLAELPVALGDRVAAGDPLARLDNPQLHQAVRLAEAAVRSSGAKLAQAKSEVERSREEAEQSEALAEYVSANERRAAQHDVRRTNAAKKAASSDLYVEKVRVDQMRAQVDALTLVAPFDAEVAALNRDPGQSILAEEPVARLVSTERVVRFAVDAEDVAAYGLGTEVDLTPAGATEPVVATVTAIAPEVDVAGMLVLEASLPDGTALRTGTRGTVAPRS